MMYTFFSGCCYRRLIFFGVSAAPFCRQQVVRGGKSAPSFYALDIQVGSEEKGPKL
jgi:hypothetical protein